MKRFVVIFLSVLAMVFVDVSAKKRGGGSFGGSRSTSTSKSYSTPSKSYSTPKKQTTGFTNTSKSKPSVSTTTTKPKATTAVDAKLARQRATIQRDNAAAKKFTSKSDAEAAYKSKLASTNKYNTPTPPSTRPSTIPQTVNTAGGKTVNVTYNQMPGGGYGYGYMDPLTSTFVTLSAMHMIADASNMRNAGYGNYDSMGRPIVRTVPAQTVVVQESSGMTVGSIIFIIFCVVMVIFIAVKLS